MFLADPIVFCYDPGKPLAAGPFDADADTDHSLRQSGIGIVNRDSAVCLVVYFFWAQLGCVRVCRGVHATEFNVRSLLEIELSHGFVSPGIFRGVHLFGVAFCVFGCGAKFF